MTELGMIPPQAPDMERAIIGAMLIDTNAISKAIELISDEYFYKPINRILFATIIELYNKNIPIDQLTVAEHLRQTGNIDTIGGEQAIVTLMNETGSSANIEYHCSILIEKYQLREIISLSSSIQSQCADSNAISKEIFDNLMSGMMLIREKHKHSVYSNMMETMLISTEDIMSRINLGDKLSGIPTGFRRIDRIIDGCQAGDLIIIAARPSVGKSALAANIAVNAAYLGYGVAIFSFEMTKVKIGRRMIASRSHIGVSNIHSSNYTLESIKQISDAGCELSQLPIYIDDQSGINHIKLYAKLKLMMREHDIKLVIIDHLQLMSPVNQKQDMRAWITDTSKYLKAYAKSLNIPIICLSQLSRTNEKEKRAPILSDLRESGAIEADADIVMFIHNPEPEKIVKSLGSFGKYINEEEAKKIIEILVSKNREGMTGKIYLHWDKFITKFSDLEY